VPSSLLTHLVAASSRCSNACCVTDQWPHPTQAVGHVEGQRAPEDCSPLVALAPLAWPSAGSLGPVAASVASHAAPELASPRSSVPHGSARASRAASGAAAGCAAAGAAALGALSPLRWRARLPSASTALLACASGAPRQCNLTVQTVQCNPELILPHGPVNQTRLMSAGRHALSSKIHPDAAAWTCSKRAGTQGPPDSASCTPTDVRSTQSGAVQVRTTLAWRFRALADRAGLGGASAGPAALVAALPRRLPLPAADWPGASLRQQQPSVFISVFLTPCRSCSRASETAVTRKGAKGNGCMREEARHTLSSQQRLAATGGTRPAAPSHGVLQPCAGAPVGVGRRRLRDAHADVEEGLGGGGLVVAALAGDVRCQLAAKHTLHQRRLRLPVAPPRRVSSGPGFRLRCMRHHTPHAEQMRWPPPPRSTGCAARGCAARQPARRALVLDVGQCQQAAPASVKLPLPVQSCAKWQRQPATLASVSSLTQRANCRDVIGNPQSNAGNLVCLHATCSPWQNRPVPAQGIGAGRAHTACTCLCKAGSSLCDIV